jgi:hypothetical protein
MTFIIWGVSTVMTVNVKVAHATHETPFSPLRDKGGCLATGHRASGVAVRPAQEALREY